MLPKNMKALGLRSNPLYSKPPQRNASPRIIFNVRKQSQMHLQHGDEQNQTLRESLHFNDSEYFKDQHRLISQKIYTTRESNTSSACHRRIRRRPNSKSNLIEYDAYELNSVPAKSENLFQTFLEQETKPTQLTNIIYSENNYSQGNNGSLSRFSGQRKNSSNSPYLNAQTPDFKIEEEVGLAKEGSFQNWTLKLSKQNKSACQINPYTKKEYLHNRVKEVSHTARLKKINSLDYSIIKPNQIKAVSLNCRSYQKCTHDKKKKKFPEILAIIRQRQEAIKQQILIQAQRQRKRREQQHLQLRAKIHTSYTNRKHVVAVEQKNEVLPWQVEGASHLADFI